MLGRHRWSQADVEAGGHREARTQTGRRRREDGQADRQVQRDASSPEAHRLRERQAIDRALHEDEQRKGEQGQAGREHLGRTELSPDPIRPRIRPHPARQGGTQRMAREERRQHQRERVGGVVRDDSQKAAGPEQFIRHPAEARDDGDQQRRARPGRRQARRSPPCPAIPGLGDTPMIPGQGRDADAQIDERRDQVRLDDPEPGDQPAARDEAAEHRAGGVRGIEPSGGPPRFRSTGRGESRQDRQGPAHQQGRRGERQHRHDDPDGHRGRRRLADQMGRRYEQPAEPLEEHRHRQAVEADRDLHQAEESQRASRTARATSQEDAAQPQAAHEGDEDRHHRPGRRPEQPAQHPRPDHLQHQAGSPRRDEQDSDSEGAAATSTGRDPARHGGDRRIHRPTSSDSGDAVAGFQCARSGSGGQLIWIGTSQGNHPAERGVAPGR